MNKTYLALSACLLINGCQLSVNPDEDTSDNNDGGTVVTPSSQPNILLIISDDQGIDASAQYNYTNDKPTTPTLDSLASEGIVFDNAWATPACSTTRAALLTGQYGFHSGISSVPGNLAVGTETIQSLLKSQTETQNYQTGFFGKWHLGTDNDDSRPNQFGIDHYAGNLTNPGDYYNWQLTINGQTTTSTEYHTSKITDLAIDWINNQDQEKPWFTWLAYSAPHSPFHLPPTDLHSRDLSGDSTDIDNNKREYFLAAIEAMDKEIGRLLTSLSAEARANTIVLYIGDNGSPAAVLDKLKLQRGQNKGTLYEGGVNVPFVVSGAGVTRQGERETKLVNSTDLFTTIAEIAGLDLNEKHDSESFKDILSTDTANTRDYSFVNYQSDSTNGYAIRNQDYKLIESTTGTQEFYSLKDETVEITELLATGTLTTEQNQAYQLLDSKLDSILERDSNGGNTDAIDITNATFTNRSETCTSYVNNYISDVLDINESLSHQGDLKITQVGDKCVFNTNAIPNHNFNDGDSSFPNQVSAQSDQFQVTTTPSFAAQTTALSLQTDNALLLNGVKVDLLAAGCFGIGNGKVGCNDMSTPWRYDPMHAANGFRVDTHNAHAQPDGTYHYHGTPNAFYDQTEAVESPVIGFAADGFPIFGPFFKDSSGVVRKAVSSYMTKAGTRPSGDGEPGGSYDGTFRDDYEYVQGLGDLDECNGMTQNGVYGYYITDNYPYVLACFKGTPDSSFDK
ncbi:sulfatase-like hydrolase/transferase [Catenovulum maritimum]|uniref:N-acetylgalactosamine 6-sulfatase (GALNS) n=1 Tax=Catenovulum maritimum TaxID=1513271 RepID=A0A0J8GTF0_9ALTE|nr:sulfatase-like hydrolase/transferase [Catenovulum maritimum]KMT64579.1 N-acetylgalactosamine 6-sulfatase (GALNS) [Catenovulum maritimum]